MSIVPAQIYIAKRVDSLKRYVDKTKVELEGLEKQLFELNYNIGWRKLMIENIAKDIQHFEASLNNIKELEYANSQLSLSGFMVFEEPYCRLVHNEEWDKRT